MKKKTALQYKIKENSIFARLACYKLGGDRVAFVLGKTIHLHNVTKEDFLKDKKWLRHELCHLQQFKEHGFLTFVWKYVIESARKGYYNNKYEVEARASEYDHKLKA